MYFFQKYLNDSGNIVINDILQWARRHFNITKRPGPTSLLKSQHVQTQQLNQLVHAKQKYTRTSQVM